MKDCINEQKEIAQAKIDIVEVGLIAMIVGPLLLMILTAINMLM